MLLLTIIYYNNGQYGAMEPDAKINNALGILIRVHPRAKFSVKYAMKLAVFAAD
jgi:hypothetical protein